MIVPSFLRTVAAEAPSVTLSILPATRIDLSLQIDIGWIDAAQGSFSEIPKRLQSELLFDEPDVLVVAPDHPLAGRDISLESLSALRIFAVAAGGAEDAHLAERGLVRRTEMFDRTGLFDAFDRIGIKPALGVAQPHFLALPALLAGSRAAAIVPAALGEFFRRSGTASVSRLPWTGATNSVQMIWHERIARDPAQGWLRSKLLAAALPFRQREPQKKQLL